MSWLKKSEASKTDKKFAPKRPTLVKWDVSVKWLYHMTPKRRYRNQTYRLIEVEEGSKNFFEGGNKATRRPQKVAKNCSLLSIRAVHRIKQLNCIVLLCLIAYFLVRIGQKISGTPLDIFDGFYWQNGDPSRRIYGSVWSINGNDGQRARLAFASRRILSWNVFGKLRNRRN